MNSKKTTTVSVLLLLSIVYATLAFANNIGIVNVSSNAAIGRTDIISPDPNAPMPENPLVPDYPEIQGLSAESDPVSGSRNVIVVLAAFSDITPELTHTNTYYDTMLFATTESTMRTYYYLNSYGLLMVTGSVTNWFTLPNNQHYYGGDKKKPGDDEAGNPDGSWALIRDAASAADASVDFSQYDSNGDGIVDHFMVVHSGQGQESANPYRLSDEVWSARWADYSYFTTNDPWPGHPGQFIRVGHGTILAEGSPLGTFAHEFAHDINLPDLYNTDTGASVVGRWSLMDKGSWNGVPSGSQPSHLDPWSKNQLGWLTPTVIFGDSKLGQVIYQTEIYSSLTPKIIKLPIGSTTSSQYYLVEWRQQVEFDASLPDHGLLVWQIDDTQPNNNGAVKKVGLKDAHPWDSTIPEDDLNNAPYDPTDVQTFKDGSHHITVRITSTASVATSVTVDFILAQEWPGPKVPTPPSAIGRPYQDIRGVSARSDGTNLYVNVTLDQGPPRRDNETHVNMYVAIDNGTAGGSWRFPDEIDVGYTVNTAFWEYCLALYRWTGLVPQRVNLTYITEYVDPPKTPSWVSVDALALGVTVTNSTDGKIVQIKIPYTALAKKPSTVTIGVVTSEDLAKVKDTVGSGYTRTSFSQWTEVSPAITSLSTGAGSPVSASDPAGDFVGKSFWDITGVTVGMKNNIITVNVTFQNVSCILWSMEQWRLAIGIDIDHAAGSGQNWMAFVGYCDARIDESIKNAYWERCVVLDSPADIHIYDKDLLDWGSSGIWAPLLEAENKISVNIPNWILPPSPDRKLNLTILSGMDGGNTSYDVYGNYVYAYSAENTQGFYNLTTAIKTGVVMYPYPLPTASFNTAMGRPYQDITGVWAKSDGTHLNVSVTLREAPPRADSQAHVDIYVAIDTKAGGQDWFPDNIDARYNISEPEHFWEYCLALYDWTGTTPTAYIINSTWNWANAIAQGVTVTNSTDGRTVMMYIPLTVIGSPSTVTLGVLTSEDGSTVKDIVGNGTAILVGPQWIQIEPAIIDLPMTGSSVTVTDPAKDFCGKSFWDITGVKAGSGVMAGVNCLIVNVTFLDISGLSMYWDQWWLAVEIDTDHLLGRGEPWTYAPGVGTDTRFVNESVSEWELCAVINSPTDIVLWDVSGTYPKEAANWVAPPHGVTASLIEAQNKVQVAIPKSWLMLHTWDYNLTLTVVVGVDAGWSVYDIYGTYEYGYVGQYGVKSGTYPQGFYVAHTDSSLNKTGPFRAEFSLKRYLPEPITPNTPILPLYAVILNLDLWLDTTGNAQIVANFYRYDGTYQGQTILNASITLPVQTHYYGELTNPAATPPGYQDAPIEIVEIVLDYGGGQLVIARIVYTLGRLFTRIRAIIMRWGLAGVAERIRLFSELVDMSKQWAYAPYAP